MCRSNYLSYLSICRTHARTHASTNVRACVRMHMCAHMYVPPMTLVPLHALAVIQAQRLSASHTRNPALPLAPAVAATRDTPLTSDPQTVTPDWDMDPLARTSPSPSRRAGSRDSYELRISPFAHASPEVAQRSPPRESRASSPAASAKQIPASPAHGSPTRSPSTANADVVVPPLPLPASEWDIDPFARTTTTADSHGTTTPKLLRTNSGALMVVPARS